MKPIMYDVLRPEQRDAFALQSEEHLIYLVTRCLKRVNEQIADTVQGVDRVRCNLDTKLDDSDPFIAAVAARMVSVLEANGWDVVLNLAVWGTIVWLLVPGSPDALQYANCVYRRAGVLVDGVLINAKQPAPTV